MICVFWCHVGLGSSAYNGQSLGASLLGGEGKSTSYGERGPETARERTKERQ